MTPSKCCVGGCKSTRGHCRIYCIPKNDYLRALWLSFLVPTNGLLSGLSKQELVQTKGVCEKHFDDYQFDRDGKRLRYSYPTLFTDAEITHRIPLNTHPWTPWSEHNYFEQTEEVGGEALESFLEIRFSDNDHDDCTEERSTSPDVPMYNYFVQSPPKNTTEVPLQNLKNENLKQLNFIQKDTCFAEAPEHKEHGYLVFTENMDASEELSVVKQKINYSKPIEKKKSGDRRFLLTLLRELRRVPRERKMATKEKLLSVLHEETK